ncbi:MAG: Pantoate-beta-alanine ligase [Actinomycetota bacterium]
MKISESIYEVQDWLKQFPEIELDYLKVVGEDLLQVGPGLARVLIAAKIGDVRLIDNIECELGESNV